MQPQTVLTAREAAAILNSPLSDFRRKRDAILAILQSGSTDSVGSIIGAIRGDEETAVLCVYALSAIGIAAVPSILSALENADERQRTHLLEALGEIGDPASVPLLLRVAERDEALYCRIAAMDALVRFPGLEIDECLHRIAWEKQIIPAVNAAVSLKKKKSPLYDPLILLDKVGECPREYMSVLVYGIVKTSGAEEIPMVIEYFQNRFAHGRDELLNQILAAIENK